MSEASSKVKTKIKTKIEPNHTDQELNLMALAGGEEGLRVLLSDFYDRVFRDPMIGYLFMGQDKTRLIEREVEWTARLFGAEVSYQGRPLREAHSRHPIRRGHFHRRNQILKDVLRTHHVPEALFEAWSAHSDALETAILGPAAGSKDCEQTSEG